VKGEGCRVSQASGFTLQSFDQGPGFRVQGSGFRVQGSGFRVQGSGFMVQGSGFMVQGAGFRGGRTVSPHHPQKSREGAIGNPVGGSAVTVAAPAASDWGTGVTGVPRS